MSALKGAAVAVAVIVAAFALAGEARADTATIRPGGSWNVGAVYVKSVHAGGTRLARACNATGSVCRYIKTRPRSACAVFCPTPESPGNRLRE